MKTNPLSPALIQYLSESEYETALQHAKSKKGKEYLNELIYLINLCQSVADYYPECKNAFGIAVRGMQRGIAKYRNHQSTQENPPHFSIYLTWFMKTAIEYEMDMDNEDTRAWHWD